LSFSFLSSFFSHPLPGKVKGLLSKSRPSLKTIINTEKYGKEYRMYSRPTPPFSIPPILLLLFYFSLLRPTPTNSVHSYPPLSFLLTLSPPLPLFHFHSLHSTPLLSSPLLHPIPPSLSSLPFYLTRQVRR